MRIHIREAELKMNASRTANGIWFWLGLNSATFLRYHKIFNVAKNCARPSFRQKTLYIPTIKTR